MMDSMEKNEFGIDLLGLHEEEALRLIKDRGYSLQFRQVTKSIKPSHPEGKLRVVRQRVQDKKVDIVMAYEKVVL